MHVHIYPGIFSAFENPFEIIKIFQPADGAVVDPVLEINVGIEAAGIGKVQIEIFPGYVNRGIADQPLRDLFIYLITVISEGNFIKEIFIAQEMDHLAVVDVGQGIAVSTDGFDWEAEFASEVVTGDYGTARLLLLIRPGLVNVSAGKGYQDRPLLFCAAWEDWQETAEFLLRHGADVNYSGPWAYYGQTPLHVAVEHGHTEIVRLLLDYDADTSRKDSKGRTPLARAEELGLPTIVEILKEHGAKE